MKIRETKPPGTIEYTGKKRDINIDIRYIEFYKDYVKEESCKSHDLILQDSDPNMVQWYDISGLHDVDLVERVGKNFGMHPLVTEDIVDVKQRPSYVDYQDGNLITLKHLEYRDGKFYKDAISIYFGKGYVITFHELDRDIFQPLRSRIHKGMGRIQSRHSDYLAYAILDFIVDNYYAAMDILEEQIEEIEENISTDPNNVDKGQIYLLKKDVMRFRKSIAPLREAINGFSRTDSQLVEAKTKVFIRDVFDHTIQIMDGIDNQRDILAGLQDLYLSELSMKMNRVMQFLTITTAIFVPLSFLTGLYGMNFEYIPELQYRDGYFILWGCMILLTLILIVYFKKQKWF